MIPSELPKSDIFNSIRESETILHDCIPIIFKYVITDHYALRLSVFSTFTLVCKSWKLKIDCLEIGRYVFQHLGWLFPEHYSANWKNVYREQMGHLFIASLPSEPKIITLSYPTISKVHQYRFVWLDDKGFIYYKHSDKQFQICPFIKPDNIHTISVSEPITTLSVFRDHIVCGTKNGQIMAFDKKSFIHLVDYQAHYKEEAIRDIFELEGTWISVSNTQIVKYNILTSECQCLLTNYNPYINEYIYPSVQCIQNHLFFKFDPAEEIAITPIKYYKYSLKASQNLEEISGPRNRCEIKYWGGQIATFFDKNAPRDYYNPAKKIFVIHRFPFHPLSVYSGKPQEGSLLGSEHNMSPNLTEATLVQSRFHFKGHIGLIIYQIFNNFLMQLVDLKNDKILFEHWDPLLDINQIMISNHKIIYFQTKQSKIVILDFTINF